eukprot:PhM_4_TR16745/c0_g4_i7/m.79356
MHGDYNLHPVYYTVDNVNDYIYALDVGTHTSTRYMRASTYTDFNNVFRTSAPVPPLFDWTSDVSNLYIALGFAYIPRISLSTGVVTVALQILWNGAGYAATMRSILHLKGWLYVTLQGKNCIFAAAVTQTVGDAYTYCVTNPPLIQIPSGVNIWHLTVS